MKVLSPEGRDLLLAIVDRGDRDGELPDNIRSTDGTALLNLRLARYLPGGKGGRDVALRPTEAGRLVADLLRQQDGTREQVSRVTSESNKLRTENSRLRIENADLLRSATLVWPMDVNEEGWANKVKPPHPAVYVPDDPTWVPGVFGGNCDDAHEWRKGRVHIWLSADKARLDYAHDLGMIRPIPRPPVFVSIPANLADEAVSFSDDGERALAIDEVLDLIRNARPATGSEQPDVEDVT